MKKVVVVVCIGVALIMYLFGTEPTMLARPGDHARRLSFSQWVEYSRKGAHPFQPGVSMGYGRTTRVARAIAYPGHWIGSLGLPQATEEEFMEMVNTGVYHTW